MRKILKKRNYKTSVTCFLFFLFFAAGSYSALAQQKVITGKITSNDGMPLPGVTIVQKGVANNGSTTDFDGNYTIQLKAGSDILVFSYIGFKEKQVKIEGKATINVNLEEDTQSLDEVVVIGYAPISREKVLGALGTVKAGEIEESTPVSTFDAVQGRLSGVQILSNGGPGAGFDIKIRGTSTFGSGGTSPLYVVDGQQLDNIDNIDPSDIASLEVLKDGATAAIYGSKAANGVVLITTKSGKGSGNFRIDVSTSTAVTKLIGGLPLANTKERILYEKLRQSNPANLTTQERDSLSLLNRNSYDLQDLLTRSAITTQLNVAVSSSSEKGNFYWNTGFLSDEGIVVNSSYKRITSLVKADLTPSKVFSIGTKVNLSYEEGHGLSEGQVFQQMVERIPYYPIFEPNGDFTPEIAGRQNPVAEAYERDIISRAYRVQQFSYAQINFSPSFSFKATLGINGRYDLDTEFSPIIVQNPNNPVPTGSEDRLLTYDIQQEDFVNYKGEFGKHSVSAFAGIQMQKYYIEEFDVSADFVSDAISTFNNIDPTTFSLDRGENSRHNTFSQFGGFNYDYAGKYLVGGTIRRDGSSRFGENNEYGYFPSATVGWRVSKESFMENVNVIDNLMFRFSFGKVGNERIGNYFFTGAYVPGNIYNGLSGVAPSRLGNPDLSWESTASTNLGLDLSMLKRSLNLNVDFWKKETTDLLATVPLPEESGYSGILKNVGSVENRGVDVTLSARILQTDNFTWNSSVNFTYLENEVTKLAGGTPFQSGDFLIEEGQPIGNIFGFRNLGVYQYNESNAYNDEGVRLTPNFDDAGTFVNYTLNGAEYTGNVRQMKNAGATLGGGDVIWEDINNDLDITADDRQIIGNGIATFFGGFSTDLSYKNFELSFLFDANFGNDIYQRYDETRNDLNSANETPSPEYINNSWRQPGDITVYPSMLRVAQQRESPNSFYVVPGDFIKLRFVRLNYRMPKSFTDDVKWLKAFSMYMSFNNMFTWTNYTGYNPELGSRGNPLQPGVDNLRYPNSREIIFGLKVQL